jgi:hypothetical protein
MPFTVVPPHNLDLQAVTRHMIGSWFVPFSGGLEAAAAGLSLAAFHFICNPWVVWL